MLYVLIFCIIICIAVILITALVTNKAYSYKHEIDPLDTDPHLENDKTMNT